MSGLCTGNDCVIFIYLSSQLSSHENLYSGRMLYCLDYHKHIGPALVILLEIPVFDKHSSLEGQRFSGTLLLFERDILTLSKFFRVPLSTGFLL